MVVPNGKAKRLLDIMTRKVEEPLEVFESIGVEKEREVIEVLVVDVIKQVNDKRVVDMPR